MKEFIQYQLEVAICMIALTLLYLLLWRKDTNFTFKRFLLLSIPLCSIIIPLINLNIRILPEQDSSVIQYITYLPNQLELAYAPIASQAETYNGWEIAFLVYIAGMAIMLIRLIVSYYKIWQLYRQSVPDGSGLYRLIEDPFQSFSFFNLIMINRKQSLSNDRKYIFAHEKAHSRQGHSFDVLWLELIKMLHWFNPIIWIITRESKQNLEYLADQEVAFKTLDLQNYQYAIVQHASNTRYQLLKTQFSKSNLKNRIIMMNQPNNRKIKSGKLFVLLPILSILFMSFSLKFENLELKKELIEILPFINSSEPGVNDQFTSLTNQMKQKSGFPIIPGSFEKNYNENEYVSDLAGNDSTIIKNSMNQTAQNTIVQKHLSNEFRMIKGKVVSEDGQPVNGANVIIKGTTIGTITDHDGIFELNVDPNQHELFIVSQGFESKLVNITDKEEISIKLNNDEEIENEIDVETNQRAEIEIETEAEAEIAEVIEVPVETREKIEIKIRENPLEDLKEHPLILLDGKEISYEKLQSIDHNKIESIQVLKDKSSAEKFGKKGENGVVIIKLKKGYNKANDNSQNLSLPPYTDITIIDDENKEGLKLKANGNFNLDKDNPPLIYLDGNEISLKELNKIDPNTIARVDVIKGESAVKQSGEKGKNGIIRIKTKKQ